MNDPARDTHPPLAESPARTLSGSRVLLIAPQPFYAERGTPMNVLQLCRALTRAGFQVDLVTYPLGRPVEMPGLRIVRAPRVPGIRSVSIGFSWRKLLLDASLALRVAAVLLRRRYRVVHAVEEAAFLALPLTWLGVPLVYDLDSLISEQLAYSGAVRSPRLLALVRRLEALTLRRARAAITVCASLSEAAHRLAPETSLFQIEDTPLPETLREPVAERVEALRREWALGGRRPVVYTGNLERYQGIELLIDAAERLHARVPQACVVVVGGEPEPVEALRHDVARRGLEGCVRAVGARPPDEMREWMGLAELLVSPRCEGDNTPLKLYTYMASGTPIVATRLRTHTQVLDDTTAFLCDPAPEALAGALARALEDPAEARTRAARARERLERDYSFAAFERKLRDAYAAVLKGGPKRPTA